jgi:hypothetical protein
LTLKQQRKYTQHRDSKTNQDFGMGSSVSNDQLRPRGMADGFKHGRLLFDVRSSALPAFDDALRQPGWRFNLHISKLVNFYRIN